MSLYNVRLILYNIVLFYKQCRNCRVYRVFDPFRNLVINSDTPMYLGSYTYNQRHQSLYSAALLIDAGLQDGDKITELSLWLVDSSYIILQNFQV